MLFPLFHHPYVQEEGGDALSTAALAATSTHTPYRTTPAASHNTYLLIQNGVFCCGLLQHRQGLSGPAIGKDSTAIWFMNKLRNSHAYKIILVPP